jgi:alpha-tubulin suppressor-like RCC1 family protein
MNRRQGMQGALWALLGVMLWVVGCGVPAEEQGEILASTARPLRDRSLRTAQLAVGTEHALFLASDGTVWSWGSNQYGQLGNPSAPATSSTPLQVPTLANAVAVASGEHHALALLKGGAVWAWGRNNSGQLGDGTLINRGSPTQVVGLTNIVAVEGGLTHSLALRSDGTLWAWGDNTAGQLGDGTTIHRSLPVQVVGLSNVVAMAGGFQHSVALRSDGTLWAWGRNFAGELGDGNAPNNSSLPVQVSGLTNMVALSTNGNHTLALRADGTVWAWGYNANGQLGNGTSSYQRFPGQVSGLTGVVALSTGANHSIAVRADGTIWTWGWNYHGQLGNGTVGGNQLTAQMVPGLTDMVAVAGGYNTSIAVRSNGTLRTWGYNSKGQLADGTYVNRASPVIPIGLSNAVTSRINAGVFHSLWLAPDGTVRAWGANSYGQLGDGSFTQRTTGVTVPNLNRVVGLSGGVRHSVVVRGDGTVRTWGDNAYGQLGTGAGPSPQPNHVAVPSLANMVAVSAGYYHTLALRADGTVWSWGFNSGGQLGDGTNTHRTTPVAVLGLSNVVAVAAGGYHSLALRADGTVWAWGEKGGGQLGDGTATWRNTPVQVSGGLSGVVSVAAGGNHSMALLADGTVRTWGYNATGQLGDGTNLNRFSPVVAVGLGGVIALEGGSSHTLALRVDSTVWSWGGNANGQLGDGTWSNRYTPGPGPSIESLVGVAAGGDHSLALRANAGVRAWGNNANGQLGNGTTTHSNVPVVVPLP